ncbi:hypothetical protein OAU50_01225 [Planctomycetota bacterium]|nr:hypothetical protein [Planctomycetota bacterium]
MKWLLLIFLALLPPALSARNVDIQQVNALDADVARMRDQVEPAFDKIESLTGLGDSDDLTLVLVGGARTFGELAQRDGLGMNASSVLGYAMPSKRRVVLNLSGVKDRGMDPIGVLRHELCHLVLGSTIRTARPLWFEEGVCQYVEAVAHNDLKESAGALPNSPDFQTLEQVSEGLRQEAHAGPAYTEVRQIIRYIVKRFGEGKFKNFVAKLTNGTAFEAAFAEAFDEDISAFEANWLKARKEWATGGILNWLGVNFMMTTLLIGAFLLVAVVLLLRRRRRGLLAVMEQQGRDFPEDPDWSFSED